LTLTVFRFGEGPYPNTIDIAYPKAGTKIGTATLWVYDLMSQKTIPLPAPDEFIGKYV